MLRNFATKWINSQRMKSMMNYLQNARTYSERRRRTGIGRKKDIFEERGAASEAEYFRKESARQLEELREQQKRLKEEKENKIAEKKDKEEEKDKKQEK
ncbi:DDRGK domain-containing protein 1-like [Linepithema humile]|uniref:DDRGK domain-containing protein 1-like n=1 Tax=Linepithema humile TaxID=83485 RepID=UPI00351F466C